MNVRNSLSVFQTFFWSAMVDTPLVALPFYHLNHKARKTYNPAYCQEAGQNLTVR